MTVGESGYGHDGRRLRDHAARGAVWSAIAQLSIRVSSLITFVILARLLSPEDFGAIALASSLVMVLSFFADMGFSAYLVQADQPDRRTYSTAFWFSSVAGFALAMGLAIVAWPLSGFLKAPEAAPVMAAVSLSVFVDSLRGVPTALLKRRFQFRNLSLQMLAATTAGQVVAIIMAVAGAGVWALVGQVWVSSVVGLAVLWRSARWRPTREFSLPLARVIAAYGINVTSATIVGQGSIWLIDGLVSRYLGIQQLGLYSVANRVVMMAVATATHAAGQFGTPLLASIKHNKQRLEHAYLTGQAMVTSLIVAGLGAIAINADLLIPTLLGEKWADAAPVFQLLAIGGMGRVIGWTINRPLLLAIGKPRLSLYSTLAASILLVMGTLLAAQVSLVAVAAVNAVVWAAFVPVNVLVVSRTLGISAMHTLWQVLRAVSIAALAGLPALVVTMELTGELPDLALAALSIVVYAVVHAGLLRLLAPSMWDHLAGMVRALLRRRNQASVSSPAS